MANKASHVPRVLGPPTQKMNRRHHEVMTWLLANPQRTLTECAHALGYTIPWISRVVNSDMFKAELRQQQDAHRERTLGMLEQRVAGTTHTLLTKINERVDNGMVSEKFLHECTGTLLQALGYSPSAKDAEPQRHLHVHVDGDQLERARQLQRERYQSGPVPAKLAPAEVRGGESDLSLERLEDADRVEAEAWQGV